MSAATHLSFWAAAASGTPADAAQIAIWAEAAQIDRDVDVDLPVVGGTVFESRQP